MTTSFYSDYHAWATEQGQWQRRNSYSEHVTEYYRYMIRIGGLND
jgi:hypothetical protein